MDRAVIEQQIIDFRRTSSHANKFSIVFLGIALVIGATLTLGLWVNPSLAIRTATAGGLATLGFLLVAIFLQIHTNNLLLGIKLCNDELRKLEEV